MLSPEAGFGVLMEGRPACIQASLADPGLVRLVNTYHTHTHTELFARHATVALNAKSVGALCTLKVKAVTS